MFHKIILSSYVGFCHNPMFRYLKLTIFNLLNQFSASTSHACAYLKLYRVIYRSVFTIYLFVFSKFKREIFEQALSIESEKSEEMLAFMLVHTSSDSKTVHAELVMNHFVDKILKGIKTEKYFIFYINIQMFLIDFLVKLFGLQDAFFLRIL